MKLALFGVLAILSLCPTNTTWIRPPNRQPTDHEETTHDTLNIDNNSETHSNEDASVSSPWLRQGNSRNLTGNMGNGETINDRENKANDAVSLYIRPGNGTTDKRQTHTNTSQNSSPWIRPRNRETSSNQQTSQTQIGNRVSDGDNNNSGDIIKDTTTRRTGGWIRPPSKNTDGDNTNNEDRSQDTTTMQKGGWIRPPSENTDGDNINNGDRSQDTTTRRTGGWNRPPSKNTDGDNNNNGDRSQDTTTRQAGGWIKPPSG